MTFYSHCAGFRHSCGLRTRNLHVGESEFGNEVPIMIPKSGATLFFHTHNKKYAAVVDLEKDDPTTGLVVELRPRHSATGRLVDHTGTPLAHYEFSLNFNRTHEMVSSSSFGGNKHASVKTFEYEYCVTDADGYFSVERLIPGLEYQVSIHVPSISMYAVSVKMPILQPEQYREPYDLGDVVVRWWER